MSPILVLLRKDFINLRRNRAALVLTFVIPFAMIYLFGWIFGINSKDSGPSGIPIAVVNASDHAAAAKLVDAMKGEKSFRVVTRFVNPDKSTRPLTEADLRPMMQAVNPAFRFALIIPADLITPDSFGLHLKIFSNPRNEIETQTVNGILQKTILASVPELFVETLQDRAKTFLGDDKFSRFNRSIASAVSENFGGDRDVIEKDIAAGNLGLRRLDAEPDAPAANATAIPSVEKTNSGSAANDLFGKMLKIDTEQVVGANVKNPMATSLVGGWAIQFLLFALSASAASLFRERDAGIFQRLLAAPVTRAQILWSKFLYGVMLGLVQLIVLFLASSVLYGTEVLPHLALLSVVCIFAAAACTSFGMLLASLSSSPEAASSMATFLIMLMSAIGGAWFPITLMPLFIQQFSKFTLVYWSMEGFSAVLWAGQGFVQILPILGILGGITVAVMSVALWQFNRNRLIG